MQENDRIPATNGDVTHLAVMDVYATTGMIVFGRNPVRNGSNPLSRSEASGNGGIELIVIPRSTRFGQSSSARTGKRTHRFHWFAAGSALPASAIGAADSDALPCQREANLGPRDNAVSASAVSCRMISATGRIPLIPPEV